MRYEVGYQVENEWVVELFTDSLTAAQAYLPGLREYHPLAYIYDTEAKEAL